MYEKLDQMILERISQNRDKSSFSLICLHVISESSRIAEATKREPFRVVDGGLQSLRKAKKIRFNGKFWELSK